MRVIVRIRMLLAAAVGVLLIVVPSAGSASATTTVTLDGVRVALPAGTLQVITVRHTSGTYARATMWTRTTSGRWAINMHTSGARIGSGGF